MVKMYTMTLTRNMTQAHKIFKNVKERPNLAIFHIHKKNTNIPLCTKQKRKNHTKNLPNIELTDTI